MLILDVRSLGPDFVCRIVRRPDGPPANTKPAVVTQRGSGRGRARDVARRSAERARLRAGVTYCSAQ